MNRRLFKKHKKLNAQMKILRIEHEESIRKVRKWK
jgi:hypothetical protein